MLQKLQKMSPWNNVFLVDSNLRCCCLFETIPIKFLGVTMNVFFDNTETLTIIELHKNTTKI